MMQTEDTLEEFLNWWLANRPFNTPQENELSHAADTHGVVLYRHEQYQVELFNVKPNSEIPRHIHPNVDSFEVYMGGDIEFSRNEEVFSQSTLGDSIRVKPNDWHGGKFGPRGGCFLSVQLWLNKVSPKFVGNDWKDTKGTPSYEESAK